MCKTCCTYNHGMEKSSTSTLLLHVFPKALTEQLNLRLDLAWHWPFNNAVSNRHTTFEEARWRRWRSYNVTSNWRGKGLNPSMKTSRNLLEGILRNSGKGEVFIIKFRCGKFNLYFAKSSWPGQLGWVVPRHSLHPSANSRLSLFSFSLLVLSYIVIVLVFA